MLSEMLSTNDRARVLMTRHHHFVKNRQQSMLNRSAAEVGIDQVGDYHSHIQGKPSPSVRANYDRSNASMS